MYATDGTAGSIQAQLTAGLPIGELLAAVRELRSRGVHLDEVTTRAVMDAVGIDPGPVWDRPLHPCPMRLPIRPEARTRFETMVAFDDLSGLIRPTRYQQAQPFGDAPEPA